LIEALTYRLADHTTSDDARRYRDEAELAARWREEPLRRLRLHLAARGAWSEADEAALERECREEVEAAVAAYLATPPQPPESIFAHLFAKLPAALALQRDQALAEDGP
jgi:pyruvate dehydrogenase E1 component alpha subunit